MSFCLKNRFLKEKNDRMSLNNGFFKNSIEKVIFYLQFFCKYKTI